MSISLRKHASKLIALTLAVSAVASISAAALEQPVALLSSNLDASVGMVLTSDEVDTAEQALAKAKAASKTKTHRVAQPAATTTVAQPQSTRVETVDDWLPTTTDSKPVTYSATQQATDAVKSTATPLGVHKLTFYCPCARCNGVTGARTASGTVPAEGRTIAVDPSVIPLGSRVYIEGYGEFIAEDTGGVIKNDKIDIFVSSHDHALALGVQYANVYLL